MKLNKLRIKLPYYHYDPHNHSNGQTV